MNVFCADHFVLPLPAGHRFPMRKYARLRERLAVELPGAALRVPDAASAAELLRVHDADYGAVSLPPAMPLIRWAPHWNRAHR